MMARSDDESSGGDIPFTKSEKTANNQLKRDLNAAAASEDEEDELEEDEYVVEQILGHKFSRSGELSLKVKWQGYSEMESTWEPEENLENCPDELEAYFQEIGGKPVFAKKPPVSLPLTKKRKLFQPSGTTSTPTPPPANSKRGKPNQQGKASLNGDKADLSNGYPKGSWEDEVLCIETLTKDEHGNIYAWLLWKDNRKTSHRASVAYAQCPQKCLQFYEAHLHFNVASSPQPPAKEAKEAKEATVGQRKYQSDGGDAEEEEDETAHVKKVATRA